MTPFSLIDPITPFGARARGPEVLGPRRRLPVLTDVPRPARVRPRVVAAPATASGRGTLSLDTLLTGTWNELSMTGGTSCPLCTGEMLVVPGGGVARCGSCGSELS